MALTNQQLLTRGDRRYAAKKKAAGTTALEYDPESRQDFLTGFHKRKLARQAEAKRKAEELNRQQRVLERRRLREARRQEVEPGLERLKEAEALIGGARVASDDDAVEPHTDGEDEFAGFADSAGILKRRDVAYGDSNVTIEAISMDPYVDMSRSEAVLDEATRKANEYASYVQSLDAAEARAEDQRQRQKKKKFRYLPKSERSKMTRKRRA